MGGSMSTIINATTTNGVVIQPDNSGSLQLATNSGTTAVTIDTSQNVGIGTTSPATKLEVNGPIRVGSTDPIYFGGTTNYITGSNGSNYLQFVTNGSERMRIDSSGNVLINTTSTVNSSRLNVVENLTSLNGIGIKNTGTTYASSTDFIVFVNSADALAGRISHTAVTTVAYTTTSDYRLKENIVPMAGALNKILQLKPVTYTWKQDGSNGQGFIAHELQEIVSDCVVGEKDAVDEEGNPSYQSIDTSFLVATLTAAIQEMKAIIDEQSARITALENK